MNYFKRLLGSKRLPAQPASNVDEIKRTLLESSGARDFLSRSQRAGFSAVEETGIGMVIKRDDCLVIFAVVPKYGEDKIRRLSMQEKGGQAIHLIEDGEFMFDDIPSPPPVAVPHASPLPPSEPTLPTDAKDLLVRGALYYLGQEKPKDYREALKWFRLAADKGSAEAQRFVGIIYDNGQGVARDSKEALKWFRLAADQGDAGGQFCLGVLYRDGRGVSQNYKEGWKWIRLAADKGNASAQYNLGVMYFQGIGVPKDLKEGVRWWRLAAAQGHPEATHNLAVVMQSGAV